MIKVLIPSSEEFKFWKFDCQQLYENVQDKIGDKNSFDFIIENTFFYIFVDYAGLIGAIYYFIDENNKLFMNGFSLPKKYPQNVECIKLSTQWFSSDIYAKAQNKASALCLKKAGFKEFENSIYVLKKNI